LELHYIKYFKWLVFVSCFQVVKMTRNNDIQFCKGFWGLAENSFVHVCFFLSRLLGNFY